MADASQPPTSRPAQPRRDAVPILVVLVDEAALTRETLAELLQSNAQDFNVRSVSHCHHIRSAETTPDVIVFNGKARALRDTNVSAAVACMMDIWPTVPRLIISEHTMQPVTALDAVRIGWHGYFPANERTELLIAAIRLVALGGVFVPPSALQVLADMITPITRPE